jgi:hypothetical protein
MSVKSHLVDCMILQPMMKTFTVTMRFNTIEPGDLYVGHIDVLNHGETLVDILREADRVPRTYEYATHDIFHGQTLVARVSKETMYSEEIHVLDIFESSGEREMEEKEGAIVEKILRADTKYDC